MISTLPISVVLAVRNEAETLDRCLTAVKDLTDDLTIVDGNSTDDTIKIAKKYTSRVFKEKHRVMFHQNKQIALDKARHNWILQLDADEVVTPELKKEIMKTIRNTSHSGFSIPRKNFFLGRFLTKGGQYPDRVIRLVRKDKAHFPCQSVHEQIAINGTVGELQSDLLHYSDPTLSRYLVRFNRYTSLEAEKLLPKINNPFLALKYVFVKPTYWFLLTYFRHKGLVDGLPGFTFSFLSALHYPVTYFKTLELKWAQK